MLAELLFDNARRLGDRTALAYGDERLSYDDLADSTRRLAGGLASIGVQPGDRAIVLLPNCPEFVLGVFAVAALGAAVVLLDPQSKEHELSVAFHDCLPSVVLTDSQGAERCRELAERLGHDVAVVAVGAAPAGVIPIAALLERGAGAELGAIPGDTPVLYQYSSGSTGRPKRVERTHANCVAEARMVPATLDLTSEDVILCAIPLFHAYGLGDCLFTAAGSGARLVLQPQPQPFTLKRQRTLELIESERATFFPLVPYMAELLVSAPGSADVSSLRCITSAGSALPESVFIAFDDRLGVPIRQLYGCTECPSISVNVDPDPRATAVSVGHAMRGVEIVVRDENGVHLGAGEVGEVGVRSAAASAGYVGDYAGDTQTFRDGWVFPGDLGFLDDEGRLTIAGRTKIFIEVHGHKVDPLEVEDVLALHPAVEEAIVVGARREKARGEVVKAAVVPSARCTERELIRFCKERLASFKVPEIVEFRESIPRSQLGKVLRKELV